jgi:type II secretory pathway component GspD/PulD (secretin)
MRNYFLLVLILFSSFLHAAELQIIHLNYRSAEEIIPLVRPLIDNKAVVTGSDYKLIVRASPQQINDIKILLKELDRPLQQLIISVRQDRQFTGENARHGVAGSIGNDKSRLQFGRPARPGGLNMQYRNDDDILQANTRQRDVAIDDNVSQQVRTISGQPAYITIGQSRPVPQQQTIVHRDQVIQTQNTYYQDSITGFYVTPRVHGEQVILQIYTQRQQPIDYRVESSQISTSVQGKLGEWIALGGSDENSNQSGSGLFQKNNRSSNDLRNVSVRVTLAH